MKNVLSIQSHVVFGHAGNSASVFPMCRMGIEVWPLNTVQFSNHTQYGHWKGQVMNAEHLIDIIKGIGEVNQLKNCDAVLSGYIGSPEQGKSILEIVKTVKKENPNAWYFCDPVMGHPEKGCIVASGVSDFYINEAAQHSDIMAPNLLELETLSGRTINSVHEAIEASRFLCEKGPKVILVKHLSKAGYKADKFEMLLVTPNEAWHISRPLIDFGVRQPVGVGDITSGLLLADLLLDKSMQSSLEHVTAAVYAILLTTFEMGQYEIQSIAAQEEIVNPIINFKATKI